MYHLKPLKNAGVNGQYKVRKLFRTFIVLACLCVFNAHVWHYAFFVKSEKHRQKYLLGLITTCAFLYMACMFSIGAITKRTTTRHAVFYIVKHETIHCLQSNFPLYQSTYRQPAQSSVLTDLLVGLSFVFTCQSCLCEKLPPLPSPIIGQ